MNNEIIKKFGIEKFDQKLIMNLPADIQDFDGMSFGTAFDKSHYDLIFAFVFSLEEFAGLLEKVINDNLLNPNGVLYFAYPKKGNKRYKEYIGRDDFFGKVSMDSDGYINDSPIKFNKMAAFDDVFTVIGLKHEPKRKKTSQPSQCVGDYVERIPELRKHFENHPEVLASFDRLTAGYQRDWARYVFGVKNAATADKRLSEMENILKQGYKSVDLYKRNKK
jgi:hypothetical protein